ncbi:MAG: hypothetical protein ACLSUW_00495 [Akkermansia sp.]
MCEPALNRPGLAIAGFYSYFANKRIRFSARGLAYLQNCRKACANRAFSACSGARCRASSSP